MVHRRSRACRYCRPRGRQWELCLTVNDSWGYQHADHNHKSVRQLVRWFTETIAMGGNLLLDVGPRQDGTIPAEQAERLEGLGAWIARNGAAVHGSLAAAGGRARRPAAKFQPRRRTGGPQGAGPSAGGQVHHPEHGLTVRHIP